MRKNTKHTRMRVAAAAAALLVAGCQTSPPSTAGTGPPASGGLSTADAAAAQQAASDFVTALGRSDTRTADALMAPPFRASTPPAGLQTLLRGPDKAFVGARSVQFDPPQAYVHGNMVACRLRFSGRDGLTYRAVVQLRRAPAVPGGSAWQISALLPPVGHTPLKGSLGSAGKP